MSDARHRLTARRHRPDYQIVMVVGLLLIIGLISLVSIGAALQNTTGVTPGKQFVSALVGLVAFGATSVITVTFWHRIQTLLIWLAVIASTLLIIIPGDVINPEINGAQRWLFLGPISFQPAELIKFVLLIYFASFLAQRAKHKEIGDSNATLVPSAIILGVLGAVIVVAQRDLGTMLVVLAMMFVMLYVAGAKWAHLAKLAGGVFVVGLLSVLFVPHRFERLTTFISPGSDLEGAGYHINQAQIAIGSGGLFGNSLGGSVQAYGYLPEAANDSIFAIFAEQFGFVGVIVLLALFGWLLAKLLKVIETAPNMYTRLLAAGVFTWVFAHIVVNVGAMLNLVPLTGITLPFLSYGGSSLLFIMAALGLVFNISRYTHFKTGRQRPMGGANASDRDRRRHGRTRYAH